MSKQNRSYSSGFSRYHITSCKLLLVLLSTLVKSQDAKPDSWHSERTAELPASMSSQLHQGNSPESATVKLYHAIVQQSRLIADLQKQLSQQSARTVQSAAQHGSDANLNDGMDAAARIHGETLGKWSSTLELPPSLLMQTHRQLPEQMPYSSYIITNSSSTFTGSPRLTRTGMDACIDAAMSGSVF